MRTYVALILTSSALLACETTPGESGCPSGDCDEGCDRDEYSVHGDCQQLTACSPSQYQLIAPTATSDRVCDALTTCRSSQYERKAPTATSDRECKSLTECRRHSQYESAAPTSTSDRECSTLTTCGRDEYETQPPTDTTDRGCSKVTVCEESEYEAKAPTATSDRVCEPNLPCPPSSYRFGAACRPLTECKSYEFESAPATATSDRVCTRVTECTGGQQEIEPPTATSDRVCGETGPCGYGYYESAPATATRDRECTLVTTCTAQQYEVKAPTATSNRICAQLSVCREGQYESVAPTATSDRVCTALTACTATQYETAAPTPTSDRECAALTVCIVGTQYQSVAPTATSDRVCTWLTECGDNQYESAAPTATSDRVCTTLTTCDGNQYQTTAPTATSDRVCTALTVCDFDEVESVPPTATSDRECEPAEDICAVIPPYSAPVVLDPKCIEDVIVVEDPWNLKVEAFIELSGGSYSTPIIANLDDDNNDTLIDEDDEPELVYGDVGTGTLYARHRDGTILFSIPGIQTYGTPLVADIDQDGDPEVVTSTSNGFVVAYANDGTTQKWATPFSSPLYGIVPTIGDVDGDGDLEIAVEYETGGWNLGVMVLDGTSGDIVWSQPANTSWTAPVMADLDRDGKSEVISSNVFFSHDGTPLWTNPAADTHFAAVANVDDDPEGEVLTVTAGHDAVGLVTILDSDGTPITTWSIAAGTGMRPGPPCIADFDKDGTAEVAIPYGYAIQVYELDGTQVWGAGGKPITDTSGIAGCTAYDVDGDGQSEVLYADEETFWIFDGLTGTVRFSESAHSSGTLWEYPPIADFDKDGSGEVFVASNRELPGIVIYGHNGNGWAPAGTTWNIHDFSPTKIGADNQVNLGTPQPWETYNIYRGRPTVELNARDLRVDVISTCNTACGEDDNVTVAVSVSNHGVTDAPSGLVVHLFTGNEGQTEPIASVTLDQPVPSGGRTSALLRTTIGSLGGYYGHIVTVDTGRILECNSENNSATFDFTSCQP